MGRLHFDLDFLRSYVTGVELGSFAQAAERLGRSTSAVSAQLKKLEEQVGAPILRKAGRGMVPTAAGETLLAYARRLLELNDEAASAVRGVDLEGGIRLGMPEDFGERVLTEVLGRFAKAHPRVRIEAQMARNADLLERLLAGRLDLTLAWDVGRSSPHAEALGGVPMQWIAAAPALAYDVGIAPPMLPATRAQLLPFAWSGGVEPLPLVMFDAPCLMRSAATAALDRAGIPWRIAFSSPSLSGVWAAVAAGLGVTVRTHIGLPASLQALDASAHDLPALPHAQLILHRADATLSPTAQRLWDILQQALAPLLSAQAAVQS
ncbi:LysR substrate-binding domain-containing protein [Pseudoduganella violacea]|uniref:DNA-binding transcriptional LysR family regulator n=1 Tax=Pseudoduganella violacea TaxID=1715466 RepID=A0A7W5FUK7_9BURK|nr:LysR substrate-binding domain-containing protein [Pseudoduganella violacea]MBB3119811.1 DNA-binding transcriptional LysR family regulator [Pseudoduganella violacea]